MKKCEQCICPACDTLRPATHNGDGRMVILFHQAPTGSRYYPDKCPGSGIDLDECGEISIAQIFLYTIGNYTWYFPLL